MKRFLDCELIKEINSSLFRGNDLENKSTDKKSEDVIILFTNDIHCGINEESRLATLATYKNELKKKYKYVVTVDAGDAIEGSALGTISKGEICIEVMNFVGYDFAIFGNHEFNYGLNRLKELVNLSNATYLNSNVEYIGKGDSWINDLKPYEIVSYGNVNVGFIGITTPLTLSTISSKNFYENDELVYQFDGGSTKAFIENIQKNITKMKIEGANYIIAITHLGDKDYANLGDYSSSYLAEHTTGIDAIIDGHSHTVMSKRIEKNLDGKDVFISQIGSKLKFFGQIVIKDSGLIYPSLIQKYPEPDKKIQDGIDAIVEKYEKFALNTVARTNVKLPLEDETGNWYAYTQESTIGNLIADSIRKKTGADIALMNAGGIRAGLKKGYITYKDIIDVIPFSNTIYESEVTGKELLDILEYTSAYAEKGGSGSCMQVSGLRYDLDVSKKADFELDKELNLIKVNSINRVSNVEIFNGDNYELIDLEKTYTIGSISYILVDGGCGLNCIFEKKEPLLKDVATDFETLVDYINGLDGDLSRYADFDGRINIKSR
mgnify:CR=1 FL=1